MERLRVRLRRPANRWLAIVVAASGASVCVAAIVAFVVAIVVNALPWYPDLTIREYYQAAGAFYSQGFTVGFFLCFFLILVAVTVATRFGVAVRSAERPRRGYEPP